MPRKLCAGVIAIGLLAAACTSGHHTATKSQTVELWVQWQDREFASLRQVLTGFEKSHPGIKVHPVAGQGDQDKATLAISSGQGPDLITIYDAVPLAKLCSKGLLQDIAHYEDRDHVTAATFVPPLRPAFSVDGHRCALPFLTDAYGFYYNKDLLAAGGYSGPPRTTDEFVSMAVKLTKYNADGSVKVAGFDPLFGFLENWTPNYIGWFGATYLGSDGKSNLSRDPRWTELFTMKKRIIDAIGYNKLKKFATKVQDEGSSDNPFEVGKVAMEIDGDWRTAYIASEHPELNYGTAAFPVPSDDSSVAGASNLATGVIAIPKGAKHAEAAWELAKYLAVDTAPLVQFTNAIHNQPTTVAAIKSPKLDLGPNNGPFAAALLNARSSYDPSIVAGPVWRDVVADLDQKWEAGKIKDLHAALVKADRTIDALIAQGG